MQHQIMPRPPVGPRAAPGTEKFMKILVVDDERVIVKGIKFNLENEGYTVDVGYDGEEAGWTRRGGTIRPPSPWRARGTMTL